MPQPPPSGWRGRRLVFAAAALAATLFTLDRAFPPNLARLHPGIEVLDRHGRTLSTLPAPGGIWRLPTAPADLPQHLIAMLLAAEDARFRWHPGVDPLALSRAAFQWIRAGRVVSGGSTLTMQAARLLEPRPRTLRSKFVEILRALQLEARFSKDEILAIWLTLAPQGGNLEGLRAGAFAWFGRSPSQLDAAEAALLVALARRPEALRPDRHPMAARAARDALLRQRAPGAGQVSAAERDLAFATPVPTARQPMPRLAPHLARQLAQGAAPGARIATTLDRDLQAAAEALTEDRLLALSDHAAMAMVVAETQSREIRALVGGSFGVETRAGMLDLTRAIRSPGSAQKPFLYALAFEAGVARPETLVADLPFRFGSYAPENFSRDFVGRITAADALRQSLNLPAVALLSEFGALRYATALKLAGSPPRLAPGAEPSLPLALGGAGTTLRELVALYALLGDGGRAAPLVTLPTPPTERPEVVLPRAAAEVAGILVNPFPGGGPAGVAWKTGTSWGGRDGWAVGLDARHVAGVWVGRPDGTPIPGLTGRGAALPALAAIFARLPAAPRAPLTVRATPRPFGEAADRLRLLFPMPGAVLAEGGPVTLRAAGGRRPLVFLVDGAPIEHQRARREAAWVPPGPGFYRVTVLDADGVAAGAELRVR
ncbi:penicillin-binding protein 1C [Falsiroseomonas tokyonensis]|uniref:peptidoglycan glycosyltransferase n=1 Tax=Falsiroseomonas tokyonensis TaxID=430521 RepID=A0ABV7BMY3_9PROT